MATLIITSASRTLSEEPIVLKVSRGGGSQGGGSWTQFFDPIIFKTINNVIFQTIQFYAYI